MSRLCTVCGCVTSASRCGLHPRTSAIGANHAVHTDPRWTALSKRMIARHVGQYGWVCPGDGAEHSAHPSTDLTGDNIVPLEEGGAPFDGANVRVLCKSWNSTLGARLVNARRSGHVRRIGLYHSATIAVQDGALEPVLDERAQIRARYLG